MLDEKTLREYIGNRASFVYYDITDSTNTQAKRYADAMADIGTTVFIAREQTAGRGRLGRSFLSPSGGIYMSLLFPAQRGKDTTALTATAAVCAARAIRDSLGIEVDIKWVNDLYLNGKKIAGILTEGAFDEKGNLRYYIIGLGINVYKTPDFDTILPIATSLEDALGHKININDLTKSLADRLLEVPTCDDCIAEYRQRSFVIGREVTVISLTDSYPAEVVEILDDYSLLVRRLSDGEKVRVFTGEVSIRL